MVQLILTGQLLINHLIMHLMTPLLVILISLHLSHLKEDTLYNLTGLMQLLQIILRSLLSSMLCLLCQIQYQLNQSLNSLHDWRKLLLILTMSIGKGTLQKFLMTLHGLVLGDIWLRTNQVAPGGIPHQIGQCQGAFLSNLSLILQVLRVIIRILQRMK